MDGVVDLGVPIIIFPLTCFTDSSVENIFGVAIAVIFIIWTIQFMYYLFSADNLRSIHSLRGEKDRLTNASVNIGNKQFKNHTIASISGYSTITGDICMIYRVRQQKKNHYYHPH